MGTEPGTERRRLSAIVFTDMAGYTSLSQRDERLALSLLAVAQGLQREQFLAFGGREVKSTGDGFLVEFPNALEAAQCALEIQRKLTEHNAAVPTDRQICIRIGIHVGDVVEREGDIYGDGVNIAARIEPLAVGGGACISATVMAQVQNKLDAQFTKVHTVPEDIVLPLEVFRMDPPGTAQRVLPMPKRGALRKAVPTFVVAVAALGAVAWGIQQATKDNGGIGARLKGPQTRSNLSVAVLPFVNMSADKDDEYLSDGMTEELLNALAKVKGLRVPGRTSCFAFKGQADPDIFKKVGRALNVEAVLEGSVRRAGNQMRITVQLIKVADGYHMWSETYDGPLDDVLRVQNDVAVKVVAELRRSAGLTAGDTKIDWPTRNPEAYRLYMLGRHYSARQTLENSRKAVQLFQDALRLDPQFALAYCGLVDDFAQYLEEPRVWKMKIREYVQKALEIDPNLAEAHVSLSTIQQCDDWDHKAARVSIERAISLNPNLTGARLSYAGYLMFVGELKEALAESDVAVALDPLSPMAHGDRAVSLYFLRDYRGAIESANRAIDLDPTYQPVYSVLGWAHLKLGNLKEAVTTFEKRRRVLKSSTSARDLACAYAAAGQRARALALLKDLEEGRSGSFVYSSEMAVLYAMLGMSDRAVEAVESAIENRDWGCFNFRANPTWDVLRSDPRVKRLGAQIDAITRASAESE